MKNEDRFRIASDCVFANVKRIVRELQSKSTGEATDKVYGIHAETKLTRGVQNGLNEYRKFYILEKALRTLVNMVPEPKDIKGKDEIHYHLLHKCNVYQPQEILGGHPIIEFVLKHTDVVNNSAWKSPSRT